MKLTDLRIESFKCFRQPLEIAELAEGLNLFTAPNEAGKSTVAEAIRAAFFERHRSSSVEYLRPWGDGSATPTVELEFELGGKSCRLVKAFLGKKRCELIIDGQAMDGTIAEDHLAGLLGFKFPGKGASAPEHMGIPGLLWIKQGTSYNIAEEVRHASDHLRSALGESLGELATSSGDAVLRAVELERNELLTPSTGTPRGAYADVLARQTELEGEVAGLKSEIAAYDFSVDRLASLRRDHQRDEAERPWMPVRDQLSVARARMDEANGLAAKKLGVETALNQHNAQVTALRNELQAFTKDEEAVEARRNKLRAAQEMTATVQAEVQAWEPRHAHAAAADSKARARLAIARQVAARHAQSKSVADLTTQLEAASATLNKAQIEQAKFIKLETDVAALKVADADVERVRACAEALRDAQAKLDAVAAILEFDLLPGVSLAVSGERVSGASRRTVVGRTRVDIDGVGRIEILPGASDLETVALERDRSRDALTELLQALGAASVPAVEERVRQYAQRAGEVKASKAVLNALAPKGLQALTTDLATLQARLADARQAFEAMPEPSGEREATLTVDEEQSAEESARTALDGASSSLNEAKLAAANASAQLQGAQEELDAAEATLRDPEWGTRKAHASTGLVDALAQQQATQSRLNEVVQQLQSANVSLLQQDVERLAKSASQLENAHAQRGNDITRLEVELETKGALGLEETSAEKQRELEHVQRRVLELKRRALALDHLLNLLREKRLALARRLRAPLQKHLNHYLQILFPGASVDVGDDLSPSAITRIGANGPETGEFEELSIGAREQMGVVARLAYADLLQEAGKPTLLILDDALVHTDEERLGQMKRVLYDAATRHQILVFTCHPVAWRDLGVPVRSLDFLAAASPT